MRNMLFAAFVLAAACAYGPALCALLRFLWGGFGILGSQHDCSGQMQKAVYVKELGSAGTHSKPCALGSVLNDDCKKTHSDRFAKF